MFMALQPSKSTVMDILPYKHQDMDSKTSHLTVCLFVCLFVQNGFRGKNDCQGEYCIFCTLKCVITQVGKENDN